MNDTSRDALPAAASSKIRPWHPDRDTAVHVRRSTPRQVTGHREATACQHALAGRATALGWPVARTRVVEDVPGRSGRAVEGRPGFRRMPAEVALDCIGLIHGLEMSRLARSCRDWH